MTDEDLANARVDMVETRRRLDLPVEDITDEQVYRRALNRLAEDSPDRLHAGELREVLDDLMARQRELRHDVDLSAELKLHVSKAAGLRIVPLLAELDRRGALTHAGHAIPEQRTERREGALARVAELGGFWGGDRPTGVDAWLAEQSAATLRTAGQDAPSRSALVKACARWSWSRKQVEAIYEQAFPPPPPSAQDLARRHSEYDLITMVADRARKFRDEGRERTARELITSANTFLRLWLDDETDPVVAELRRHAEHQLR